MKRVLGAAPASMKASAGSALQDVATISDALRVLS